MDSTKISDMRADEKRISIIIPVYNVEQYLRQCLDSLCGELVDADCEMILVDDGSSDHSGSLCDAYAGNYETITVVHQRHAGAAAARNTGLGAARGDYILFIDADDYVEEGVLTLLSKELRDQADFYFLQMQKRYPDGSVKLLDRIDDLQLKNKEKAHCIRYLSKLDRYPGSACAKMARRQMVLSNHIFFEEGVTAEDLAWTMKCILCARTFRALNIPFYDYRQMRAGSVTSVTNVQTLHDLKHAIDQAIAFADFWKFCAYRHEIYAMTAYEAEVFLLLYGSMDAAQRTAYEHTAKKICRLLKYRRKKRTVGIRSLISLAGVRRGARILYFLRQNSGSYCVRRLISRFGS